ncbi:hypothetical protein HU200_030372 [Digitaria exilis]|uniref:Strictosidine synthase conserved region domain-containing protein n=1 Tax=Digitaria exilis TaxID=1010633 RepID=A0A835BSM2_9POAL|nr:hypothetical protein HU200_030372 [Digitaria exilis]
MKTTGLVVLAAAVAVAAAFVSLDSSRLHDDGVAVLEIRGDDEGLQLIPVDGGAAGPESVAFDASGGGPYMGVSDGRVLRWLPAERRWVEHSSPAPSSRLLDSCRGSQDPGREHECGRPLGLKFNDNTGELYVADAYHGLRVVGPQDNVSRPLVPEWQGSRPFSFANGIEIDYETGAIYFTETSTRFQRREFLNIVITGDKTGRLLKYDPKTNKVEVLVEGLAFANGLAMSTDGNYLLIAETTSGKILRYWIKTPKASTLEEVVQIPWFPDNIRMSPRGGFWVGLHAKRGKIAEWSITYPWLKRLILKVPMRYVQRASWFLNQLGRQVIALRLSDDGKIIEAISVHGSLQKVFRSVSEVEERNGVLWIGSVMSPFLGVYKL